MALKVGELYTTLEMHKDNFDKGMKKAENRSSGLATALKVGLGGAVAAVGAAFVGMAKTGLDNMRAIDDATKQFQVDTGASAEEAERFAETIQDMHKVNTDSYEEIAAAVTQTRHSFGDLGDETESVTQQFMDYAKVTGEDAVQAIHTLSNGLAHWGLEAEDASKVMDTIVAVSQETGASAGSLQDALTDLAPQFQAMGMSVEESAAMLGHFESQGFGAREVSRLLRRSFDRMKDPTDSQRESLEALGIEFDETGQVMGGVESGMEQLISSLSDGEVSADDMGHVMDILGQKMGPDFVAALDGAEGGMEDLMKIIEDSEGTVEEASDIYDKQLGERWELIRRQYLEPFMETLGTVLIGILEDVLDFVEKWGPHVGAVFERMSEFVEGIFGDGGEMDGTMSDLQDNFEKAFETIQQIVTTVLTGIQTFWDAWGEEVIHIVTNTFDLLTDTISNALDLIRAVFQVFEGAFTGDFEMMKDGVISIWEALFNQVISIFETLWDIVDGIAGEQIRSLVGWFQDMYETATGLFESMVEGVADALNPLSGVVDGVKGFADGVTDVFGSLYDTVVGNSIVPDMMDRIEDEFSSSFDRTLGWTSQWADDMKAKMAELAEERARFEDEWSERVFRQTATETERVQAQYDEAIAEAEKIGADTTDIHEYYGNELNSIRERQRQQDIDNAINNLRQWQQEREEDIDHAMEVRREIAESRMDVANEEYQREREQQEDLFRQAMQDLQQHHSDREDELQQWLEIRRDVSEDERQIIARQQQAEREERERTFNIAMQALQEHQQQRQADINQAIQDRAQQAEETRRLAYEEQQAERQQTQETFEQAMNALEQHREAQRSAVEQRIEIGRYTTMEHNRQVAERQEREREALEQNIREYRRFQEQQSETLDEHLEYRQQRHEETVLAQIMAEQEHRNMVEENLSFLKRGFEQAFEGILTGTMTVTEGFRSLWSSVLSEIMSQLARMAASRVFQWIVGGATGLGGGGGLFGLGGFLGIFHKGLGAGQVPGPRGAEVPVLAKGGEMFAYPSQLAAMAAGMGGGGHRTANITLDIDGKTVARAVEQPLADRVRVKGGVRY